MAKATARVGAGTGRGPKKASASGQRPQAQVSRRNLGAPASRRPARAKARATPAKAGSTAQPGHAGQLGSQEPEGAARAGRRGRLPHASREAYATKTRAARPAGQRRSQGAAPERVQAILRVLAQTYPDAECALHHRNAWELLVATILSAQCTDVRVNLVTPELFRQYPTPEALAAAPLEKIEALIRTTGFYHNKAAAISGAAKKISTEFGGEVPREMSALLTLPGVARKTANVVLGVAFQRAEGVVVDTHVQRVSGRLDLSRGQDPKQIEADLMREIPREEWIVFSHRMIAHGRQICVARRPKCIACGLERLCYSQDKTYWSDPAAHARKKLARTKTAAKSRR